MEKCKVCEGEGGWFEHVQNKRQERVCKCCDGTGLVPDEPVGSGEDVFERAMRAKYPEVTR